MKISLCKDSLSRLREVNSASSNGKNEIYINLLKQLHPDENCELQKDNEPSINAYFNPVLSLLNPINVYYYIIFNLTVVLIIPSIFPNYTEYKISSYFGFISNLRYSVYYARSLFGLDYLTKSGHMSLDRFYVPKTITEEYLKKRFIMYKPLDLTNFEPSNVNPYMKNLSVMCGLIWLSQLFHPFDKQNNVKIVEVEIEKTKVKKIVKIVAKIADFEH